MDRNEALQRIADAFPRIKGDYGLRSISLFGSMARDEAGPGSDVDLLVEFEPGRACGFFTFFRLQRELEAVLGAPVDLVTPDALKRQLREAILAEAIRAA